MKEFVFWQPTLSIHQSALLRSLAASSDAKVTLVVAQEMLQERRELGWFKPDFGKTRTIIGPASEAQSEWLSGDLANQVNIFSGIRGCGSMVWKVFCQCLASEGVIGIQSEGYRRGGVMGLLRLLRGRYDALRFRDRIDFILAIGNIGVDWFKRVGHSQAKVFQFGYFVEMPILPMHQTSQEVLTSRYFDIIYVGQLIPRKGWDILLHALYGLKKSNWRLHVVGDGKDKVKFIQLCAKLGLTSSVIFYGKLPNTKALQIIYQSDLLVLPSRWDGWGAVVNEALMCGVPVVCSDNCGAADLLDGLERGEVFPSSSVLALRSALDRRISLGKKDATTSKRIRVWSKCITGESAAAYLMEVVDLSVTGNYKPIPPWFKRPEV
jgi:glycosyltransferase involved in cell wall biosynthesis